MSPGLLLGIALLGGLGAALRYLLNTWLVEYRRWGGPGAIMLINVIGSFGIGLTVGLGLEGMWGAWLATGFCGGFTTFGTVSSDAARLAREGRWGQVVWFTLGQLAVTAVFAVAGALFFTARP